MNNLCNHSQNVNYYFNPSSTHKDVIQNESFTCAEEITYKLDNVLKLTDDFVIKIYHNAVELSSIVENASTPKLNIPSERKIVAFSENSRRNLKKKLSRIRFDLYKENYFVTLTFHNVFPQHRKELKRLIDNFNKSLNRLDFKLHYIWKLELQKRGAPHLHYMLLFKKSLKYSERAKLARKIRHSWNNQLTDKNELTYKMSVNIQEVRDNNRTVNYICKYIEKTDDSTASVDLGRRWGTSATLLSSEHCALKVDRHFYFFFRKYLLHLLKERYKLSENDFLKIMINTNFQLTIYFAEVISIIKALAQKKNRTYIIAQINSPPT